MRMTNILNSVGDPVVDQDGGGAKGDAFDGVWEEDPELAEFMRAEVAEMSVSTYPLDPFAQKFGGVEAGGEEEELEGGELEGGEEEGGELAGGELEGGEEDRTPGLNVYWQTDPNREVKDAEDAAVDHSGQSVGQGEENVVEVVADDAPPATGEDLVEQDDHALKSGDEADAPVDAPSDARPEAADAPADAESAGDARPEAADTAPGEGTFAPADAPAPEGTLKPDGERANSSRDVVEGAVQQQQAKNRTDSKTAESVAPTEEEHHVAGAPAGTEGEQPRSQAGDDVQVRTEVFRRGRRLQKCRKGDIRVRGWAEFISANFLEDGILIVRPAVREINCVLFAWGSGDVYGLS